MLILLFSAANLYAAGPKVIATNGWTAAFAELAGAEDIEILAPYEMKHPPEYELSPRELQRVSQADFIIFAGYETMMSRIREALNEDSSVELIQIKTINSYAVISESVLKIAAQLGTEDIAEINLEDFRIFFEEWSAEIKGHPMLEESVVHFHQQGPVRGLGVEPALVFGPAAPELTVIRNVLRIKPGLIIDNLHNPVAMPFREQTPAPEIIQWINFPGTDGTESLMDVLLFNRNALKAVLD